MVKYKDDILRKSIGGLYYLTRYMEVSMKIEFEKNEFWWGGIVHRGVEMPINANQHAVIDFWRYKHAKSIDESVVVQ